MNGPEAIVISNYTKKMLSSYSEHIRYKYTLEGVLTFGQEGRSYPQYILYIVIKRCTGTSSRIEGNNHS